MARGPKKHLKRLHAPKNWMLSKMGGVWAPRPSPGPHKLRESIPLVVLLRNRLKYALTRREVLIIVMNRSIKIDGKVRIDTNFPAGFMGKRLTLARANLGAHRSLMQTSSPSRSRTSSSAFSTTRRDVSC